MLRTWAMGAVLAGALTSAAFGGTVLYVDDNAPVGGNGSSWKTAYRFLQDALTAARESGSAVNEMRVAQGTYKPDHDEQNLDGTQDETATFAMIDSVALRGGYAGIGALDPDARDSSLYQSILSGQIFSQCSRLCLTDRFVRRMFGCAF